MSVQSRANVQAAKVEGIFSAHFFRRSLTKRAYLKAMRKRSVWVEPLFGEAKEFHCLRRFRLRGLRKVNREAVMVAAGQNLKRLIKHHLKGFFLFSNSLLSV